MELKLDLEFYKEKVVKYLNRKMVWTHGFLRYNLFKKMIKHITKLNNNYELRVLFLYLVEEGVFLKKKTNVRSYLYYFVNPSTPKITPRNTTITFD